MTSNYDKVWNAMNELDSVTSKLISAREILKCALDSLEDNNVEKAKSLLCATDLFLEYYLEEFDHKFTFAWNETVIKIKNEDSAKLPEMENH